MGYCIVFHSRPQTDIGNALKYRTSVLQTAHRVSTAEADAKCPWVCEPRLTTRRTTYLRSPRNVCIREFQPKLYGKSCGNLTLLSMCHSTTNSLHCGMCTGARVLQPEKRSHASLFDSDSWLEIRPHDLFHSGLRLWLWGYIPFEFSSRLRLRRWTFLTLPSDSDSGILYFASPACNSDF